MVKRSIGDVPINSAYSCSVVNSVLISLIDDKQRQNCACMCIHTKAYPFFFFFFQNITVYVFLYSSLHQISVLPFLVKHLRRNHYMKIDFSLLLFCYLGEVLIITLYSEFPCKFWSPNISILVQGIYNFLYYYLTYNCCHQDDLNLMSFKIF